MEYLSLYILVTWIFFYRQVHVVDSLQLTPVPIETKISTAKSTVILTAVPTAAPTISPSPKPTEGDLFV
jgi:hypothetical protein